MPTPIEQYMTMNKVNKTKRVQNKMAYNVRPKGTGGTMLPKGMQQVNRPGQLNLGGAPSSLNMPINLAPATPRPSGPLQVQNPFNPYDVNNLAPAAAFQPNIAAGYGVAGQQPGTFAPPPKWGDNAAQAAYRALMGQGFTPRQWNPMNYMGTNPMVLPGAPMPYNQPPPQVQQQGMVPYTPPPKRLYDPGIAYPNYPTVPPLDEGAGAGEDWWGYGGGWGGYGGGGSYDASQYIPNWFTKLISWGANK